MIALATGGLISGRLPSAPSEEQLLPAFRLMLLTRMLSEKAFNLQRQGRIGTVAGAIGQEAAVVGSAWALDPERDWIVPQYRELAAMLHHGVPLSQLFLYFTGHPSAGHYAEGINVMPIQIALAAQIPHAVGLAWGLRHQGSDAVVLTYFGEGAASEGDAHEAMNLAGVRKAPVIFLLQNNGWAISTPSRLQTAASSLAARAEGYGIAGEQVDGNDLIAVNQATARAVERARTGEGPTLIEAVTYRLGPHNTADDHTRYMDGGELEDQRLRDPLDRVRAHLAAAGLLGDGDEERLREEVAAELTAAVDEAEALAPPGADALFANVYSSPMPRLERQRAAAANGQRP